MTFTYQYFLEEFHRFWELCGKKSTTVDMLLNGWGGLVYCAVNSDGEDEKIGLILRLAKDNLDRRLPYFELRPIEFLREAKP